MEIKISRDELLKAVARVQSIIERKSNMPVLSTILFTAQGSEVQISATDLELGFRQIVQAEVLKEGSITISGRKLFEIIRESRSETFQIKEKENSRVLISDKVARFDLACINSDEFPSFIEPEGVSMIEMDGEILSDMINKTIYAVTVEEAGFKLSGILTEKISSEEGNFLRMVATDGHRLSLIDKSVPDVGNLNLKAGLLVPKKGMSEINKMASEGGTIQIGFEDKNCIAKKNNAVLMIRLLETRFPDYTMVIPKNEEYFIKVNRNSLVEAMRKMLILSNERYRAVRMTLENNVLDLVSTNPELGEGQEQMEIEFNGEPIASGFNPRYFVDTLQAMESEIVSLGFTDGSKPCTMRGESDEGFLGLIMPMRV
jgi:DNA polymerase-3 subunit beta